MRQFWNVHFVEHGSEALEYITENRVDVVVSDMRMPGMDGAELLAKVRTISPSTVRIILSGYAEEEAVLRSTRVAHQFLSKPCDLEDLKRTIEELRAYRSTIDQEQIREVVGGMQQLPALGTVHADLVAAMNSSQSSNDSLAEIVSRDVALTAELLRLVNSAFFGLNSRVESVAQAIGFLGIDVVQAIVAGHSLFDGGSTGVVDVAEVARRSQLVSALARRSTRNDGGSNSDAATAYLAGMLHQVGVLVLGELDCPDGDMKAILAGEDITTERMVFGVDRYTVGAYLLGLWGFDNRIVQAVNGLSDRDGPERESVARALLIAEESVRSGRIPVSSSPPGEERMDEVLAETTEALSAEARSHSMTAEVAR